MGDIEGKTRKSCYLGLDLGGTTVKGILLCEEGSWSETADLPTAGRSGSEILQAIGKLKDTLTAKHPELTLIRAGFGTPGIISPEGVVMVASNLREWSGRNVVHELENILKIPVDADNDANLAAFAESRLHPAQKFNNILFMTIGTGIGAGLIMNGKIFRGKEGFAGEAGHLVIHPGGRQCACGKKGCLEQYFSATAVIREGRAALEKAGPESPLRQLCNNNPDELTAKLVFDAARHYDTCALEIVERTCTDFAAALNNICMLLNPSTILLGGGVSKAGDFLLEILGRKFRELPPLPGYPMPLLAVSEMQELAGVKGAALFAQMANSKEEAYFYGGN